MGNCICFQDEPNKVGVADMVGVVNTVGVVSNLPIPNQPNTVGVVSNLLKNTRKMSNHYTINYPIHEKRKDTSLYRRTRHELIYNRKLTCFICGKKNIKKKNDEKSKEEDESLETHHFYCEKYAQTMIDWEKFGLFAKNCYNIQTGENIGANFDWQEVDKNPDIFVDSPYNMIVLCKQHHTSGNKGLHHVPFPDWILQKYPKNNFEFLT